MAKRLTNEEFVKRLKEKNPNIVPLEEYKNSRSKMRFQCLNDKSHIWETKAGSVLDSRGCPYCSAMKNGERMRKIRLDKMVKFSEAQPDLAKHLLNKDDGLKYGEWSHKLVWWVCPDCSTKFENKISNISRRGFHCPVCSKGRSYPNKFMHEILKQLNIDYEFEYSPKWAEGRKYDFYFIISNKKYIIEMDGYFHKGNSMANITEEEAKHIDSWKDEKALENNIQVIRIDCDYREKDRFDFVKDNIIKNLSFLFDFSNVDFEMCDMLANKSILIKFAESWEKHKDLDEVMKELKYTKEPAIKYLKMTEKYNLSSYCHIDEIKNRMNKAKTKISKSLGVKVCCIETGEIFDSMAKAGKAYHCCVEGYFNRKNTQFAGMLPDGTKLHWEKLTKEEAEKLLNL